MNTTMRRVACLAAMPVLAAGIIGIAALETAGTANANGTYSQPSPTIVATPTVHAHPAPEALPGTQGRNRSAHLDNLQPGYQRR